MRLRSPSAIWWNSKPDNKRPSPPGQRPLFSKRRNYERQIRSELILSKPISECCPASAGQIPMRLLWPTGKAGENAGRPRSRCPSGAKRISAKLLVPKGVNDISNLAPACRRCNRRKGSKGGLWIIRGRFWRVCLPIYTVLRLACLAGVAFVALAAFGWPPAADALSGLLSGLMGNLPQIV